MPGVNINITVNGEGETKVEQTGIKRKTRKLKNGKEVVLELPNTVEETTRPKNILNMLGI